MFIWYNSNIKYSQHAELTSCGDSLPEDLVPVRHWKRYFL